VKTGDSAISEIMDEIMILALIIGLAAGLQYKEY
jgi:hypothetical protein